jgi:hypothetical protein
MRGIRREQAANEREEGEEEERREEDIKGGQRLWGWWEGAW